MVIHNKDGFKWGVVSLERANEMLLEDKQVYKLYEDGLEALCCEADFEEAEPEVVYAYPIGYSLTDAIDGMDETLKLFNEL